MPVDYNSTVINARLTVVLSAIDAGPSFGQMRLLSPSNQTIGLIQLQQPAGVVASGVLSFSGLPLAAPLTLISDQIVAADIEDSTGTVVASGLTVGPSTFYDVVMVNPFVSSGQTVTLTYATITGN